LLFDSHFVFEAGEYGYNLCFQVRYGENRQTAYEGWSGHTYTYHLGVKIADGINMALVPRSATIRRVDDAYAGSKFVMPLGQTQGRAVYTIMDKRDPSTFQMKAYEVSPQFNLNNKEWDLIPAEVTGPSGKITTDPDLIAGAGVEMALEDADNTMAIVGMVLSLPGALILPEQTNGKKERELTLGSDNSLNYPWLNLVVGIKAPYFRRVGMLTGANGEKVSYIDIPGKTPQVLSVAIPDPRKGVNLRAVYGKTLSPGKDPKDLLNPYTKGMLEYFPGGGIDDGTPQRGYKEYQKLLERLENMSSPEEGSEIRILTNIDGKSPATGIIGLNTSVKMGMKVKKVN